MPPHPTPNPQEKKYLKKPPPEAGLFCEDALPDDGERRRLGVARVVKGQVACGVCKGVGGVGGGVAEMEEGTEIKGGAEGGPTQ